jgi:hypothetical protein
MFTLPLLKFENWPTFKSEAVFSFCEMGGGKSFNFFLIFFSFRSLLLTHDYFYYFLYGIRLQYISQEHASPMP